MCLEPGRNKVQEWLSGKKSQLIPNDLLIEHIFVAKKTPKNKKLLIISKQITNVNNNPKNNLQTSIHRLSINVRNEK